jgi:hypothetical protein
VGSLDDRRLKLLLSNVLSNTRPRGDVSQDPQLLCLALYSSLAMNLCPRV